MADMNKLFGQLLSSGAASGFAGGLAGGLAGNLLGSKSGRKLGKKALKWGGVAAVGALAYTAYQRYSSSQTTSAGGGSTNPVNSPQELTPAPAGSLFLPDESDQTANNALGLILIRAMIAASRADGRLDAQESQAIFQRIESLELDHETRSLLVHEMGQPVDVDAIVNSATSMEVAAEIYAASLLAIEVDSSAERAYLSMLAMRLQLPPELVKEIEQQVDSQKKVD
ncbi:MAG: tellurite resistance TerB family protein [Candidatus Thiodiazotropha sp. (ex. Lucinisca nassula)]|nr:tellurite resistance TerB family protein [Candidatus Thiodiazotropha sp. (ex. Lucinisca nassula)]